MFEIYDLVRVDETANHQRHLPENNRTNDANHQRHLPENNRTKRIDLSLITQVWPELQGYSSIIPLAETQ
jgi:hypothetical protein